MSLFYSKAQAQDKWHRDVFSKAAHSGWSFRPTHFLRQVWATKAQTAKRLILNLESWRFHIVSLTRVLPGGKNEREREMQDILPCFCRTVESGSDFPDATKQSVLLKNSRIFAAPALSTLDVAGWTVRSSKCPSKCQSKI